MRGIDWTGETDESNEYICFLQGTEYNRDDMKIRIPIIGSFFDAVDMHKVSIGEKIELDAASLTEIYGDKYYLFYVEPTTAGEYLFNTVDCWAMRIIDSQTKEPIDSNKIINLEEGKRYNIAIRANAQAERIKFSLNVAEKVKRIEIMNKDAIPDAILKGMRIDVAMNMFSLKFRIVYDVNGTEKIVENVPYLWDGDGAYEGQYHITSNAGQINTSTVESFKLKFYIDELGRDKAFCESDVIRIKDINDDTFPTVKAGVEYDSSYFTTIFLGQPYFLFKPEKDSKYVANIDNGKIGIVYDIDTGESQGSVVVNLKAGRTYCFQLFINNENSDMFKLRINPIADVEKLEILNPEIIPSKIWYKDMGFARNLRFKIHFLGGDSEEVKLSQKSQSGLSVFISYKGEDMKDNNLRPGMRTVYFVIDGYNVQGESTQAALEVMVVENISELDIPVLKEDVVYSSKELTTNAGKIQVKEDGYYNFYINGAGWNLTDGNTEGSIDSTPYGFYFKKDSTYLLRVYSEDDKWSAVIHKRPFLTDADKITIKADDGGNASFIFKPARDGVYKVRIPVDVLNEEQRIDISVYNGKDGEGFYTEGEFEYYFSKETTYTISFGGLRAGTKSFEVSCLRKKGISKVEISSGLENLQHEWIYGYMPYYFGLNRLRFKVTFDDGSTRSNVGLEEAISPNEDEDYSIYSYYEKRPDLIGDNDEEIAPGEYKIRFKISGLGDNQPQAMPESITMQVKRINEFSEDDFSTLKFDETYNTKDFEANYNYGKSLILLLKPQFTGLYDFSDIYMKTFNDNANMDIITRDGSIGSYSANDVGLEAGEIYALVLEGEYSEWDFSIKAGLEITKLEFADENQLNNVNIVRELANTETFSAVKFILTYNDENGKSVSIQPFAGHYNLGDSFSVNMRVDYDNGQIGKQKVSFYPAGLEQFKISSEVNVISLEEVRDKLPAISVGDVKTDLPNNYNWGKCFNFMSKEEGIYIFDFGTECHGRFAESGENQYDTENWYGRYLRIDGKADTLYTISAQSYEIDEDIAKIKLNKISDIVSFKIINKPAEPIKCGLGMAPPPQIYDIRVEYTTVDGATHEASYGEEVDGYGSLTWNAVDKNGHYVYPSDQLGDFYIYFTFSNMPEVETDKIEGTCCLLKDVGYTKLKLDKNIKVNTPLGNMATHYGWGATFTPAVSGEYVFSFNDGVIQGGDILDGEGEYELVDSWDGNRLEVYLEANRTYMLSIEDLAIGSEVYAKVIRAGAITSITLDTKELTLTPGQEGTVIATVEPPASSEEIEWTIDSNEFSLKESEDGRTVTVTAPNSTSADKPTATLTVKAKDSNVIATCKVSVATIAAEVPKIDSTAPSMPPTNPVVGLAVDKTINGQQSNAQKAEEDLQGITSSISKGNGALGAEITPTSGTSQESVQKEIQEAIEKGDSIVTEVTVDQAVPDKEEAEQVKDIVKNHIQSGSLSVEKKLDITIDIKKSVEGNGTSTIGNVTELPEAKALTFTVVLTAEQISKKMYVAYEHGGVMDIIPEGDVTQKAGIMTFRANKFSSYYLVSSDAGFIVTYENITPYGDVRNETGKAYGDYVTASAPSASGYTFLGWFDKDTGEQWDFDTDQVTGDITLVGKWQYNTPVNPPVYYYTVRFDSQGGSDVASQSVTYGQKITEPAVPKKENYIFAGWYKEKTYTTAWDFAKDTVTAETTLYAKWDEVKQEPGQVTGVTYVSTTGAITLSWNKAENADGYLIQGRTKGEKEYTWSKTIEKADTLTCKNSGLKAGTVREYIITAYRTVDGKKVYSTPSEILTAGTKPGNTSIKSISSKKGYVQVTAAKAAGAEGYEYAYSAKNQWSDTKDYKLLGRVKKLTCTNKKVTAGVYAARVRAYKTVDGKRIYGKWSAVKWFEIPTGTIAAPKILKVKVNKNTVTVTLKNVKGATGYDCVLGTEHNPIKPTPYKYIKKNQKTTTIVFKKVKKGTYYVGAHAYKTTKGKKYFSKWSNQKKIVIK